MKYPLTYLLTSCLLTIGNVHAENQGISQTKNKLQQISQQLKQLQQHLHHDKTQQNKLQQDIAITEKKIGDSVQLLTKNQQQLQNKEQKIHTLEQQIQTLNLTLHKEQQQLAKQLTQRYMMGEYQPIKWLFNQDNPYQITRILTYYGYVIRSQKQTIANLRNTQHQLANHTQMLQQELATLQTLQATLTEQQRHLTQQKQHHQHLIKQLNTTILTTQQALEERQQDKANLEHLLTVLVEQSKIRAQHPFITMRHKLPKPIQNNRTTTKSQNHGLIFYGTEGTPVTAVHGGKVVFSDWLKGYGLLLIIDHGSGYMTLYAHNQSLYKHRGELVAPGEQIGSIGHSGGIRENSLYFEVRHRGKAISASDWLA